MDDMRMEMTVDIREFLTATEFLGAYVSGQLMERILEHEDTMDEIDNDVEVEEAIMYIDTANTDTQDGIGIYAPFIPVAGTNRGTIRHFRGGDYGAMDQDKWVVERCTDYKDIVKRSGSTDTPHYNVYGSQRLTACRDLCEYLNEGKIPEWFCLLRSVTKTEIIAGDVANIFAAGPYTLGGRFSDPDKENERIALIDNLLNYNTKQSESEKSEKKPFYRVPGGCKA